MTVRDEHYHQPNCNNHTRVINAFLDHLDTYAEVLKNGYTYDGRDCIVHPIATTEDQPVALESAVAPPTTTKCNSPTSLVRQATRKTEPISYGADHRVRIPPYFFRRQRNTLHHEPQPKHGARSSSSNSADLVDHTGSGTNTISGTCHAWRSRAQTQRPLLPSLPTLPPPLPDNTHVMHYHRDHSQFDADHLTIPTRNAVSARASHQLSLNGDHFTGLSSPCFAIRRFDIDFLASPSEAALLDVNMDGNCCVLSARRPLKTTLNNNTQDNVRCTQHIQPSSSVIMHRGGGIIQRGGLAQGRFCRGQVSKHRSRECPTSLFTFSARKNLADTAVKVGHALHRPGYLANKVAVVRQSVVFPSTLSHNSPPTKGRLSKGQ